MAGPDTPSRSGPRTVRVEPEREGQRIDNFLLATLKGTPRSRIYQMLRRGEVRVNGGRVKQHYRLNPGDLLRLPPAAARPVEPKRAPPAAMAARLSDAVIYEDAGLLVVNKPSGVAVHGGSGRVHGVIEALRADRPEDRQLELVHRLDRDTSGVLMVARKRSVLRRLHDDLREGRVEKRYLALLKGRLPERGATVRAPLKKNVVRSGERVVRANADGKPSETRFVVLASCPDATLCEARPATGRTHQIRVHAAELGHPVAGDPKYGDRTFNQAMRELGLRRMFLHASEIGIVSSETNDRLIVRARLDRSLLAVLEALGLEVPETARQQGSVE
ncbi:MAG: RluA family pseudouridine synthase [Gammaproteobacteria bacterium]|nr:RluA family pseudouridine synthase [Gammaproteobacteria bacterium]